MDLNPGGKILRPWQLGFRTDFGVAGMAEPSDMVCLIELILSQGFFRCVILDFLFPVILCVRRLRQAAFDDLVDCFGLASQVPNRCGQSRN